MEYQEVLVKQYTSYIEEKDKFVDRSFAANKFYIVLVLALAVSMTAAKITENQDLLPLVTLLAGAGMAACALWWFNQDAYAYLIKVRLSAVIEKMEEHLPLKPHVLEFEEIKRRNEKKKVFFADIQKLVAFISFAIFFAMFLYNGGVWLVNSLVSAV